MESGSLAGTRVGKYELRAEIGRGGMGTVYRGYDPMLDRTVAVKLLAPHLVWEPEFVERFLREAQAAARLKHPNIVTIYDVGQEGDWYYFVMEYLEGQALTEVLRLKGPMALAEALDILRPLAEALDHAHAKGLVHRDVKPGNAVIGAEGQVTLTDFGIARAAEATRLTRSGFVIGTPEYMSPEQALGRPVDECSDQYALAVVAYEMLAGQVPFQADNTPALMYQVVHQAAPPLGRVRPDLPARVGQALDRALAKDPRERYASCQEFVGALATVVPSPARVEHREAALGAAGAAQRPERPPGIAAPAVGSTPISMPTAGPVPRDGESSGVMPTWLWAVGVVAIVAVAIGLGVGLGGGARNMPTPPPATRKATARATGSPAHTEAPPTPSSGLAEEPTEEPASGEPSLGDTWTRQADRMVMVYVPAGEFEMGSTDGDDDEQPVHSVSLDAFWVDQTEVTNAQFAEFLNDQGNQTEGGATWLDLESGYSLIERSGGGLGARSGYADHPVIEASWYAAEAYCEWVGGRLPTEAEWEYVGRGPEGRAYPWGDEPPNCDRANYWVEDGGCVGESTRVGSYPDEASWCGALDLVGNVWEWVADWHDKDYFGWSPPRNPKGPSRGQYRIVRGGSWLNDPYDVRSTHRGRFAPDATLRSIGFRCAKGSH